MAGRLGLQWVIVIGLLLMLTGVPVCQSASVNACVSVHVCGKVHACHIFSEHIHQSVI